MSICEKRACINSVYKSLSIQRQCDLIGLPRSSYYREQKPAQESVENLAIMRLIDEEYARHPFYGTRKMRYYLRRKGYQVNRKRVQRLMHKMGLQSIAPKPNTSKPHPEHKIYPYLLRYLDIICPDQVWYFDYRVTVIKQAAHFLEIFLNNVTRQSNILHVLEINNARRQTRRSRS